MRDFTYTIQDENGLHARPAGLLVREAAKFSSDITIQFAEKSANAKRLFSVMGLGVKKGDGITVKAEGADERTAAETLETFCRTNL